jgi:hydroxymethylbilane synthase
MKRIRIATRGSRLAVWQSEYIKGRLEKLEDGIEVVLVKISTKGDRDKSDFLYKSGSMGYFTSEVENALLDGRADVAVHSFKDLPTAHAKGLVAAAIPERESVCDALVAAGGVRSIKDLPEGARVGTSSLRRIGQLKQIRSDLRCEALRGNVETRVSKVEKGEVDAIIIAEAGLKRLGLDGKISAVLDPMEFPTAPAQGALAVEIREEDRELAGLVGRLDDKAARTGTLAEREILAAMQGGCSIPLGVYSRIEGETIWMAATVSDTDGSKAIRREGRGPIEEAFDIARRIAGELLDAGGREILDKIRRERE